jgi:hypothetical protein
MHRILCFCHHGDTTSANAAAARVRAAALLASSGPHYLTPVFVGGATAAVIALGMLTI